MQEISLKAVSGLSSVIGSFLVGLLADFCKSAPEGDENPPAAEKNRTPHIFFLLIVNKESPRRHCIRCFQGLREKTVRQR